MILAVKYGTGRIPLGNLHVGGIVDTPSKSALLIKAVIQSTYSADGHKILEDQTAACTFYLSCLFDGYVSIKRVTNGRGISAPSMETIHCQS